MRERKENQRYSSLRLVALIFNALQLFLLAASTSNTIVCRHNRRQEQRGLLFLADRMGDDGILINFDTSASSFTPLPSFKGGTWKNKLTARKAARYSQKKSSADPSTLKDHHSGVQNADFPDDLPAKRQRTSYSTDGREKSNKPLQVVSSLFSYNPKASTVTKSRLDDETAALPSNAPLDPAIQNFVSLGLSTSLAEHLLNKMEIKAPTAIQRASLEKLLKEDTDAFLQAETGSGKTLAYLLPIVQKLMAVSSAKDSEKGHLHRDSGLFAIILAPTRELSKQISVVLEGLLRCAHWLVPGTVIGGEKKKSEKARLRKGLNILIATPGRLADHLDNTEVLDVSKVRWLVLDEGDRLMEMGFEREIDKILAKLETHSRNHTVIPGLPSRRLTLLCSATLKNDVQKLGERSLKDAVHIQGNPSDAHHTNGPQTNEDAFSAPAQLQQSYTVVPAKLRLVALVAALKRSFIRRGTVMKAIVFMSCSDSVDFHFDVLSRPEANEQKLSPEPPPTMTDTKPTTAQTFRTGALATSLSTKDNPVQVFRLHGSLPQAIRTSTLAKYRACEDAAVLLCTDVASRGLDLPNVDLVHEYDPAFSKDDHLHRIGRTARAGRDGRASIFLLPGAEEQYIDILKALRGTGGRAPASQDVNDLLRKGFGSPGLGGGGDWEARATEWQLGAERWALDDAHALEMARRAFQSHVRAYATHVAAEKGCFDLAQVHLGHLAKAFALRDKPGNIRVPGQRPGKGAAELNKKERRANAGVKRKGGDEADGESKGVDVADGRRKMHAKMREQASMSEFNLG